jgi:nucleotidyltransferase/DNA polymerase involved in DNA repair
MQTTIRNFSVEKIAGIGKVTAKKLHDAGFKSIDQLAHATPADIQEKTGITAGLAVQHQSRARIALMASASIGDISNNQECSDCEGRGVV